MSIQELVIKEFVDAEKVGRVPPMLPIFEMYNKCDMRCYLALVRDYVWFDDLNGGVYDVIKKSDGRLGY